MTLSQHRRVSVLQRVAIVTTMFAALWSATPAQAFEVTLHFGSYSAGTGGNNPVSIPPVSSAEWELEFITDGGFVSSVGVIPGILFGGRSEMKSFFVDFGGGLVIDGNGNGPGMYSAIGFNLGSTVKFNMGYKQAIGYDFSAKTTLNPHALRLGVTLEI